MKLYDSIGPNPRFVRMVAAEKGVPLEVAGVDIIAGENRQSKFLELNPTGTTPVLVTDKGDVISETTAIAEYLEALKPQPALIGETAVEQALTRMWWRRIDQAIVQPLTFGFRGAEGYELFKDRVRCFPAVAGEFKEMTKEGFRWLEVQIGGRPFICGDKVTVVDLLLFAFVEFGAEVGQSIPEDCEAIYDWCHRMRSRNSIAV